MVVCSSQDPGERKKSDRDTVALKSICICETGLPFPGVEIIFRHFKSKILVLYIFHQFFKLLFFNAVAVHSVDQWHFSRGVGAGRVYLYFVDMWTQFWQSGLKSKGFGLKELGLRAKKRHPRVKAGSVVINGPPSATSALQSQEGVLTARLDLSKYLLTEWISTVLEIPRQQWLLPCLPLSGIWFMKGLSSAWSGWYTAHTEAWHAEAERGPETAVPTPPASRPSHMPRSISACMQLVRDLEITACFCGVYKNT